MPEVFFCYWLIPLNMISLRLEYDVAWYRVYLVDQCVSASSHLCVFNFTIMYTLAYENA